MSKKRKLSEEIFDTEENTESTTTIMPIFTELEGEPDLDCSDVNSTDIAILPLRNMVLFPGVALPVTIGRSKSLKLIQSSYTSKTFIGVVTQRDAATEEPVFKDLYEIGTIAEIIKVLEMPDGTTTVILQGKKRLLLNELSGEEPFLRGQITIVNDVVPEDGNQRFSVLVNAIKELTFKIFKMMGESTRELNFAIRNINNFHYLINFLCANIPIEVAAKQKLLMHGDLMKRASSLYTALNTEAQLIEIKADIQSKTREDLTQQQREHFLQQQIRTIQEELGGSSTENDISELRQRGEKKKWSEKVGETFAKEIKKLERYHPQAPEYSVQYNYIETFVDLPWGEYSTDNFNLTHAKKVLDKDHYGLERVKERIIEHLAVLKLRGDLKSPIICLYGPPGVGKTSLGRSVASALKRKYMRISLGGLHDEAEIRGHRRTYIGAMPGRIVQGLLKTGTSNPVFVLDEIDKIGSDFKGDPSSALLEVLDPEQNNAFHDNYLDVDYDLSKVLFIATANNLNTISQPLLDRMELIDISGYVMEEKVEIGRRHLVGKQLEVHGLKKEDVEISKKTMEAIITSYTRESGVRELDKQIAKIMRKIAHRKASDMPFNRLVQPSDLKDYLGIERYTHDKYQGNEYAGVVTGLAWTQVGGEILYVESSISKSKGEKLTLTGNLGDVMKESAILAMQYIKSHAALYNLDEEIFDKWSVHVHVPEGAIPKDGPSAGITMITSLLSTFTQRKVKPELAMTGEITLRGRVLPVGGIKEKILAAKRANIKEIILCVENRKDIEEIKPEYLKGITFHYVRDIKEVLDIALLQERVKNAIDIK